MGVAHYHNWRMSRKNRPWFPKLMHYDGIMIDQINQYYTTIYGHTKYREWTTFNENLPLQSAYGIVGVERSLTFLQLTTNEDDNLIKTNTILHYLCQRQQAVLPFLPIRGTKERKLIYEKLKGIAAMNES